MFDLNQAFKLILSFLALLATCIQTGHSNEQQKQGLKDSGGILSSPTSSELSFTLPYQGLTKKLGKRFIKGREQFDEIWVLAPAPGVWGLGPTFNEANCLGCHPNSSRA